MVVMEFLNAFDYSLSMVKLCDNILLKMMTFESLSSVEQLGNKVSPTRKSFNLPLSVEKTCKDRPFISVLTG